MAVDKKISQLTSLAQVNVDAALDVLPIVDTSAVETKKITVSALVGAGATAGISGAVLTNGTINSTTIGATTPSTGAFTTLSASGAVSLNPANANVSLAPTGTGVVTINPATAGTMNNVAIGGSTAAAGTFTSATVSTGNLTFSGTGQRITGDMSNATASSRLLFQTSTTNGTTNIGAIPNGTGTTAQLFLTNSSDPANASRARFNVGPSEAQIITDLVGTGTYLPMTFYTGGSERMRLDTSGNLGIGGTASAFDRVTVTGTLPSSSNFSIGFGSRGTIPSTSTSLGIGFSSVPSTQAASFTLSGLTGFYAGQGTFGAGSTVTNQYGYYAENNLTGATNNFGFYSNIAAASNRWNFYAAGTARNYFAGGVEDSYGNLRKIPQSGSDKTGSYTLATTDVGQFIGVGSGGSIIVPNSTFATGDVVSIFNNTAGNITITTNPTSSYIAGTNTTKASVTLATRGVATILFISGTVCVLSGNVS